MHFYMNILTTYFPDIDPPYDVYYQHILEQIELAEELGWECFMFNEHHFLGYGGLIASLQDIDGKPIDFPSILTKAPASIVFFYRGQW